MRGPFDELFTHVAFVDAVLLTTGGTGGHIFPALAVAEELRQRYPEIRLLFVGSLYGPEARLARQAGIDFAGLPVRGFLGRGFKALGASARMGYAFCKAIGLVWRFKPDAVAGFGGYASFAPMLAARMCAVPGILHEQNALAGAGNYVLARLAQTVCISLPGTTGFEAAKCVLTGNPVRSVVSDVGCMLRRTDSRRLLVMGGSQGARFLNRLMPQLLPQLAEARVEIRHQTGSADEESTRAAYEMAGYSGSCVTAFIDDMAAAYAWADLAFCRSGASTVAELCAAGLPALLTPFPHAAHDHQTANARVPEKAGAAVLLPESDAAMADVAGLITAILSDAPRRAAMREAALGIAMPDAAARVVNALEAVVLRNKKSTNTVPQRDDSA